MKKLIWIIILLILVGLVAFFYPKEKVFSCGPVCPDQNAVDRVNREIENTMCFGFGKIKNMPDATIKICYGVFGNK